LEPVERGASVVGVDERQVPVGLEERGAGIGVNNGRGCGDAGLEHVALASSASTREAVVSTEGESGEG
jgi:hypothetical protein